MSDKYSPIQLLAPDLMAFLEGIGTNYDKSYFGTYSVQWNGDSGKGTEMVKPGLITVSARKYITVEVKRTERQLITAFAGRTSEVTVDGREIRFYDGVKTVIIRTF